MGFALMAGHHVSVRHPDAPDGKANKYSLPERERRFLVADPPTSGIVRTVTIEDLYIAGTRMRLRRITDEGQLTYKFTQKIPDPSGSPGLITTLYVSESEYDVLNALPGARLRKTRYSVPPFGIDVFEGELEGLVLAEAEFTTDAEMAAFDPPAFAIAEVTHDRRFTGGAFVTTSRADLLAAMQDISPPR
jgi:CYTH domain-containing protein